VRDRESHRVELFYDGGTNGPFLAPQRARNALEAPHFAVPPYEKPQPYGAISAPREAYGPQEQERERERVISYRDVCDTLRPGQVLMGVRPTDGTLRTGTWDDVKTVLVLGAMASGKTNTMLEKLCEAASGGAYLVVCDPHGHKPDSLYQRVGPLVGVLFPGTTLAVTHEQILENVIVVRSELERRISGEAYRRPVVLVLDEWNRLQRDEEIAAQLAYIAEILGQEGRGFHMYGLFGAQRISHFANLRKSVVACMVHRIDESEAKLVLPGKYARLAPELPNGMSLVKDADGMTELLQQVLIGYRDVERVAEKLIEGPRPRTAMPAPPPHTVPQYPPPFVPPNGIPLVRLLNSPQVPFPPNGGSTFPKGPKQDEQPIEQRLGRLGTRGTNGPRQAQTPQHNGPNGLNVPTELRQKIISLARSGLSRRKIKDKLGLHGARYELVRRVLDEAGL
jgi:hypothetical protein